MRAAEAAARAEREAKKVAKAANKATDKDADKAAGNAAPALLVKDSLTKTDSAQAADEIQLDAPAKSMSTKGALVKTEMAGAVLASESETKPAATAKKKPTENVAKAANKATEKDADKAAGDTAPETLVEDNLTKANSIDDSADKKAKA